MVNSLSSRLDLYICMCVLYVYVYVMEMHVSIGYNECVLCLFAKKRFRLILHHVGGSGFHKTRLGIF